MNEVRLVPPGPEWERQFCDMAREWLGEDPRRVQKVLDDFGAYLDDLARQEDGSTLREGWVPSSSYWLVDGDDRILGTSRMRHRLTPALELEGGHIGCDIRPSARGRGHGTTLLALTLEKARQRGLDEVVITCDEANLASARIIEKNGGKCRGRGTSEQSGNPILRFRVDLQADGKPDRQY